MRPQGGGSGGANSAKRSGRNSKDLRPPTERLTGGEDRRGHVRGGEQHFWSGVSSEGGDSPQGPSATWERDSPRQIARAVRSRALLKRPASGEGLWGI